MSVAYGRFTKGVCAIDPESGKVGKVIADPDSDHEVKLEFADGTQTGYLKVTKIAQASKEQAEVYETQAAATQFFFQVW